MNIKKLVFCAMPYLIVLSGCKFFNKQASSQTKKTGLVVVNVLDKELFDDCHIKDSINIPFESLEMFDTMIDKDAEIVCYCSNYFCSASGQACKILKEQGFEHVAAYEGGTAEWFQEGLPVEGPSKSSYLQKYVEPTTGHDPDVTVITMNDLATKMGLLPK